MFISSLYINNVTRPQSSDHRQQYKQPVKSFAKICYFVFAVVRGLSTVDFGL